MYVWVCHRNNDVIVEEQIKTVENKIHTDMEVPPVSRQLTQTLRSTVHNLRFRCCGYCSLHLSFSNDSTATSSSPFPLVDRESSESFVRVVSTQDHR